MEWAGLAGALLLGALRIWQPFHADQAFFLQSARALLVGGGPGSDAFRDVKLPAIFLFYRAAGALFGYSEAGVHLLELLWMAVAAALALVWARALSVRPAVRALGPICTVGAYYAICGSWQLTQIEGLAAMPLLACGLLALSGWRVPAAALLTLGAAGGVAVSLKVQLVVVVAAVWAAALLGTGPERRAQTGPAARSRLEAAGWLALGGGLPIAATAAFAFVHGALGELAYRTFIFPVEFAASEARAPFYPTFRSTPELAASLGWFVGRTWPLLVLASIGARALLRRGHPAVRPLVAWILAGAVVVALQTWWPYQQLLLLPPVGLLAVAGVDALASSRPRLCLTAPALAVVALLAVAASLASEPLRTLRALAKVGPPVSPSVRAALQIELDPVWAQVVGDVEFLREPGAAPGPIWVYGGPLYRWASGREGVAAPDYGYLLPREREAMLDDLVVTRPAFIRLGGSIRAQLVGIAPSFQGFLDARYRRLERHPPWYIRADLAGPVPDALPR